MKRLCIIAAQTEFKTDPRVYKQAIAAKDDGWDVDVCCYHTYDKPSETVEDGCKITRVPFSHTFGYVTVPPIIAAKFIDRHLSQRFTAGSNLTQSAGMYAWAFIIYIITQLHFFISICNKKTDVYHATDLLTLLTGVLLKWKNGGRLVYDSHEMWIESIDEYTPRLKKILSIYEGFLIKYADAVTTVNRPIAEELSKRYNIKMPTVVMNTPILQVQPQHPQHDDIRVIYQGRYSRNRGIENALVGLKDVPGVKLYMRGIDTYKVGDTEPYVEELKRLNPDAIFLPPVDMQDLVQSLGGFDIGVVPYIGVNFNNMNASPNKTFEYMMAGLAVVASDIPVLKSIVTECRCGCTYKQNDCNDLRDVILKMSPRLQEMKINARVCAENEYNWGVQGKKLLNVYERMINCRNHIPH